MGEVSGGVVVLLVDGGEGGGEVPGGGEVSGGVVVLLVDGGEGGGEVPGAQGAERSQRVW